jgi:hypothetical protein
VVDPSAKVDGVKLEYRDEFGRKLTQKEAFRQICYRFHGYGPGKKAKEKRLKVPFDMMLWHDIHTVLKQTNTYTNTNTNSP